MFAMVLKHILCINVTQIICLFFIHSLNKAFYFCPNYSIPLVPSILLDVSCKLLSGRPMVKQSILTSDIDKLGHRVCLHCFALGGLIGVKHMEHQRNGGW